MHVFDKSPLIHWSVTGLKLRPLPLIFMSLQPLATVAAVAMAFVSLLSPAPVCFTLFLLTRAFLPICCVSALQKKDGYEQGLRRARGRIFLPQWDQELPQGILLYK